jgi:hypothetical protein
MKNEISLPPPEKLQKLQELQSIDEMFPDKHDGKYPICLICHEPIPLLQNLSNIEGRPAHKQCVKKYEEGRR